MVTLFYTVGVIVFVLAILASIGLHELGHMIPAKRFGGKVTQYFIGFGPTVWSRQVGETEYGVKAIPLGGYVKIVGMLPPDAEHLVEEAGYDDQGNRVVKVRKSNTGLFTQLISDARSAEWEQIRPEDTDRLFYRLAWWKKVIVMAGGPTVNLLIAFFLFWGVFGLHGVTDPNPQPVVSQVSPCIVPANEDGRPCTAEELRDHATPASKAGLREGDRFTSFNGTPITSWEQLTTAIRGNGDKVAALGIERDGVRQTIEVRTAVTPRPTDDLDPDQLEPVGFLGVVPQTDPVVTHEGPLYTLQQMGEMTTQTLHTLARLPVKVYHVALALIGVEERDPNGPVSVVGGGRIAGEIASAPDFSVSDKATSLVALVAGFNLFIGLFNFIPLLPLDGGHIAGALWEAIRRGFAKLFGRGDPGYVDVAKLLPIAYVMASLFLVMGVVLILADLIVPVRYL